MAYVQNKEKVINLKETDEKGDLVHKDIMDQVQNADECDQLMFNELMNMLTGDLAMTRYISQNVKRSGLEIWRKMHRNNDPNTYNTRFIQTHDRTTSF